jgi:hypothetical protein
MEKSISSAAEDARQALLTFRLAAVAAGLAITLLIAWAYRYGLLAFP